MAEAPIKLPDKGDASPPELGVLAAAAGGGGGAKPAQEEEEGELLAELSDHQVQEKFQRLLKHLASGLASKLHDKGVRLRENLRQLQFELDRRKILRSQKDAGGCKRVGVGQSSGGNFSCHSPKRKRVSENSDPMHSRSKKPGGHHGVEVMQEEGVQLAELPNHQIQEKIQRLLKLISTGITSVLPDKGMLLHEYLRHLQGELDWREIVQFQKDAGECMRARQYKTTESSGKSLSPMAQIDKKSLPRSHGRVKRAQRRGVGGSRVDEGDAPSSSSGDNSVAGFYDRVCDMIQGVRTELREFQAETERSFAEMRQLMMRGFGSHDSPPTPDV